MSHPNHHYSKKARSLYEKVSHFYARVTFRDLAIKSKRAWILEGIVVYLLMTIAAIIPDPKWLRLFLLVSGLLSIDLWERQALLLLEKISNFKRPQLVGVALYVGFGLAAVGRREIWSSFWALQGFLLVEYALITTYIIIKHIEAAKVAKAQSKPVPPSFLDS